MSYDQDVYDAQVALFRLGVDPWGCDGVMGPHTALALQIYQKTLGFAVTGQLDSGTRRSLTLGLMTLPPFVQAKNFNRRTRPHSAPLDLIVIHTMEHPEKPKTARDVAQWFAGSSAPQASAHYCIDDEDTIQCVLECDVAWGAPGANARGIHLEHAGYAAQTAPEWDDLYSRAMLDRSAHLAARLVRRWLVPIQHLSIADLAAGGRGFIGHVDATNAFYMGHGHTDPGGNFPWDHYLELVKSYV